MNKQLFNIKPTVWHFRYSQRSLIFKWAITVVLDTITNDKYNEPDTTSACVIYLQDVA